MSAPQHEIEIVHTLRGRHGVRTATCTCGWTSEELMTAGKATIAGWAHVRDAEQPPANSTAGLPLTAP
jgi:hypothetical protein